MKTPEELEIEIRVSERNISHQQNRLIKLRIELEQAKAPALKVGDWVDIEDDLGNVTLAKVTSESDYLITTCGIIDEDTTWSVDVNKCTRNTTARSAINWLTWDELQSLMLAPTVQILVIRERGEIEILRFGKIFGGTVTKYAVMDEC